MREPHLLRAGNPRKVIANLSHLIDSDAIAALEAELWANVRGLFELANTHYRFASRLRTATSWRQRVSRLYYAGYSATRSVRLLVEGHYSQEVGDHSKFDRLPPDFPDVATYSKKLALLRDDRNLCDYDHTAEISDLVENPEDSTLLVRAFLQDVKSYLRSRGLEI